ncbi:MAG: NAD(P)H-hydrate dehydratase [Lachnospiraceae bacterium]|nr:NAD(P)H-hydrate dehydratase [Lachnospiraceae bacterium]
MKYIVDVTQMRLLEKNAMEEIGIPALVLMERAAEAVWKQITAEVDKNERILFLCGTGNNGADGLAAARMAILSGYSADICILTNEKIVCFGVQLKAASDDDVSVGILNEMRCTDEFKTQLSILCRMCKIIIKDFASHEYNVFVDAIFGIGLSREISGTYYDCIQKINEERAQRKIVVFAVDIPSGVNGSSGEVLGIAVRADFTVTFGWNKIGLLQYPGAAYAGKVLVADIGIPMDEMIRNNDAWKIHEICDLRPIMTRNPDSHKGTYGKVAVIAGSTGMCGAAILATKAALRMGSGIVMTVSTEDNRIPLQITVPEALYYDRSRIDIAISQAGFLIVGPGIGRDEEAAALVKTVLLTRKPTVLDADAINCLSIYEELKQYLHENVILTPHMGEMARLTNMDMHELKKNRVATAETFAVRYGVICVLKDARTIITDGKHYRYLNLSGNAGMATGGSGDVLTGVIAGLLATGCEPKAAASLGVYIHGLAGDYAKAELGERYMIAGDIIAYLKEVLRNFED